MRGSIKFHIYCQRLETHSGGAVRKPENIISFCNGIRANNLANLFGIPSIKASFETTAVWNRPMKWVHQTFCSEVFTLPEVLRHG